MTLKRRGSLMRPKASQRSSGRVTLGCNDFDRAKAIKLKVEEIIREEALEAAMGEGEV
jgi:hypothetical protein